VWGYIIVCTEGFRDKPFYGTYWLKKFYVQLLLNRLYNRSCTLAKIEKHDLGEN